MRFKSSTDMRFIPALAGNTMQTPNQHSASTVYPRSRGEHTTTGLSILSHSGLSPLSRGTLQLLVKGGGEARFIPALAGNTIHSPVLRLLPAVYPPLSRGTRPKGERQH